MKAERFKAETKPERTYPYLGEYPNGTIVLFIKKNTGVCVNGGPIYACGYHSDIWDESAVKRMEGKLILSND